MTFKSKALLVSFFIITTVIIVSFFSLKFIESQKKKSPQFALEKIIKSFESHNLKSFNKHVNVHSFSESILTEFLEEPQKNNSKNDISFWDNIKELGSTLKTRLSDYIKPELVNSIEQQINTYVQTGQFSSKKDLTSLYNNKPMLEKMWLDLSGDSFTFLGFTNIKELENNASAELLFKRSDLDFSSSLFLKLKKEKDIWILNSVDNLGETLSQLETLKLKKLKSKNQKIQEEMNNSLKIQSITKSQGLSKGEFGEMRILLAIAFENIAQKEIQKFKAHVLFKKPDGSLLREVKIEDSDIIPVGDIIEKSWPMTMSPLSQNDHTIFKAKNAEIKIQVVLDEITFTDKTTLKLVSEGI